MPDRRQLVKMLTTYLHECKEEITTKCKIWEKKCMQLFTQASDKAHCTSLLPNKCLFSLQRYLQNMYSLHKSLYLTESIYSQHFHFLSPIENRIQVCILFTNKRICRTEILMSAVRSQI